MSMLVDVLVTKVKQESRLSLKRMVTRRKKPAELCETSTTASAEVLLIASPSGSIKSLSLKQTMARPTTTEEFWSKRTTTGSAQTSPQEVLTDTLSLTCLISNSKPGVLMTESSLTPTIFTLQEDCSQLRQDPQSNCITL